MTITITNKTISNQFHAIKKILAWKPDSECSFAELVWKYVRINTSILALFFLILELLNPINLDIEYSKEIYSAENELIAAFLTSDHKWRLRTELDELSPYFTSAIVEKEDKFFYWHFGVNPFAAFRAIFLNISSNSIQSGASTISMQTIRMLEKRPRNYFSKIIESIRAVQLEMQLSKKQILELYCSLLPYGGNIEGVESAAYIYFKRKPASLSLAQAITLSLIPNNPNNYRLDYSTRVLKSRNQLLRKFNESKLFDNQAIQDAIREDLSIARHEIPNFIPHLSLKLKNESPNDKILSTIRLNTQILLSEILLRHQISLKMKSINNSAAMIIDNSSHKVIAYCGSADYNDSISLGQNNGLTAKRSPGSTLKPALYALGLDLGLITPKTILYDIPTDFNGYIPENFSSKFHGKVTAEFALYNSLNIPPVALLQQVGIAKFKELLKNANLKQIIKREKHLGLSLILGACEASGEELARLFASFANRGMLHNLIFENSNQPNQDSTALISPAAAFLLSKMLSSQSDREENQILKLKHTNIPDISWKTGTSFGKRDGWAIGYNHLFTVLIWCGNFDAQGSPNLIGGETALPILFEVFNRLSNVPNRLIQPKNVIIRNICEESGKLPNDNCSQIGLDYAIKDVTLPQKCTIHNLHYISADSSVSFCTSCLPISGYKQAIYCDYPEEFKSWAAINNINLSIPPPHNPNCKSAYDISVPKILSPSNNFVYFLEKDAKQEISLCALYSDQQATLYWYLDNQLIGKTKSSEKLFFTPIKENYLIKCISQRGGEAEMQINVRFY